MDLTRFEKFNKGCSENLADSIDEILQSGNGKKPVAIGFITTDDFYGFYLCWEYTNNIVEYYDWEKGIEPDFLYQPLVDVVDACEEIDFCDKSEEKWDFAKAVLTVLERNIKEIPDEVFSKNDYKREDVLFFATMSDGDYIEEMLDVSVKMFNASETSDTH